MRSHVRRQEDPGPVAILGADEGAVARVLHVGSRDHGTGGRITLGL